MSLEPPADLVFRPARPEDRSSLVALQWRASLGNPRDRDNLLANPDAIDIPAGQLTADQTVVATLEGVEIGFAVVLDRGDETAELDGLFVEPGQQGRGIGSRLILEASRLARAMGARRLFVTASPEALDFYGSAGFETIGTAQTRFGPAPRMRLDL